jgi:hypothetical protein
MFVCVRIFLISHFYSPKKMKKKKQRNKKKKTFSTHQFEVHKDLNTDNLRIDWRAAATGDATGPNVHGACRAGLLVQPVERAGFGDKRVKNDRPNECFSTSME